MKGLAIVAILVLCLMATTASASLVANYTMKDGDVSDSSGNGHNGTIVGNVTAASDGIGMVFDGSSYIEILDSPTPSGFDFTPEGTASFWVKTNNCGVMGFLNKGAGPAGLPSPPISVRYQYAVWMNGTTLNWRIGGCCAPNSKDYPTTNATPICDGNWHNIVIIFKTYYPNSKREFYFDGSLVGVLPTPHFGGYKIVISPTSDTLKLGVVNNTNWVGLDGKMYNVQFYDNIQNETWVTDQYAIGRAELPLHTEPYSGYIPLITGSVVPGLIISAGIILALLSYFLSAETLNVESIAKFIVFAIIAISVLASVAGLW